MMIRRNRQTRNQKRRGAVLLEYSLLAAGVALICAAAVSVYGHKTNDLIASVAAVIPGAHGDDNGAFTSGKLIETTSAADGPIALDAVTIAGAPDSPRLGNNVGRHRPGVALVLEDVAAV